MKTSIAVLLWIGLPLLAQDSPKQEPRSCPMHEQHTKAMQHQADVEKHGDKAMGFSHEVTAHHFRLYSDGGIIEVTADKSDDTANIEAIRGHMAHIAVMFSNNDFSMPMFVHDKVPPGVPEMKENYGEITYSFQELPQGASVRIKTMNPAALRAIHDFLRFQIEDHHTADTEDITPGKP